MCERDHNLSPFPLQRAIVAWPATVSQGETDSGPDEDSNSGISQTWKCPLQLWTQLNPSDGKDACSLSELPRMGHWSWDKDHLWPLIERAFPVERLLLLIEERDE
jgi:hypothetical protein